MSEPIELRVRAGPSDYPVLVGAGVLGSLGPTLDRLGIRGRVRIVADEAVARLHGPALLEALRAAGRPAELLPISGRERDKNLAAVARVYDWLISVETDRSDALIAFGGGVVGDLAGFAAATYLRGIRLIQVPTTLLAMVDSSIGGKTGIDHPAGKNLIGAFHQPALVLAELSFLATLPRRELAAGWAEVVKMGVIRDAGLFRAFEQSPEALLRLGPEAERAIARSIELKGEVVAADERESDLRMILNYGHTLGHALEALTGYEQLLHGEAVAIGMRAAARLALRHGCLDHDSVVRQDRVLDRLGLPSRSPAVALPDLRAALRRDKKAVGSRLRWVLPTEIGSARVYDDVPEPLVEATLAEALRGGA